MTVASPELHIGRFTVEDVAEGGVSGVTRTAQHGEVAVDFLREEHSVAVVGKECILKLVECLEVLCPCHSDCRTVITVAPCDIVAVLNEAHARVVAVHPLSYLLVVALETQRFLVDVPIYTVF